MGQWHTACHLQNTSYSSPAHFLSIIKRGPPPAFPSTIPENPQQETTVNTQRPTLMKNARKKCLTPKKVFGYFEPTPIINI